MTLRDLLELVADYDLDLPVRVAPDMVDLPKHKKIIDVQYVSGGVGQDNVGTGVVLIFENYEEPLPDEEDEPPIKCPECGAEI